jgi:RNA polymerase sigma-70 factor (ECF subfamily)
MNEASLLAEAKNGETAAFDTLCRAHPEKLFRTVHRITRNREDAEDAVQDSLLRGFLHLKSFDGRSTFSTWLTLTRIGINSALMLLRKRRSWREIYIDESVDSGGNWPFCDVPDSSPNPESFCLQREREEALRRAIGDLRPRTRAVIELGQLQERSMKQTARVMDISTAAAKARLFHARRMLRSSKPLRTVSRTPSTGRASGHDLDDKMLQLYPNRANAGALWGSARAAKG